MTPNQIVDPGPKMTPTQLTKDQGATIWLTGLPSAGKSTIARALGRRLQQDGHRVEILDGDEIRAELTADLGFSRDDRIANVRRIGFVAAVLARNGVKVLVPVIAPYACSRDAVRAKHDEDGSPYLEVHITTPVEECATRDVKGLYAQHRAGRLTGLTGVDDPYEVPEDPDLRLDTRGHNLEQSADAVLELLVERGLA
jgi:adenylylsulfate kinase